VRERELLADARYHWGDVYAFAITNGRYTATARYGERDVLAADNPEELLAKVRRHYRPPVVERGST
jgi:hypothetical protein